MRKCIFCQTPLKESLQLFEATGVIHVRGDCPKCDKWIMWIPYKDSKIVQDLLFDAYNEQEVENETD